MRWSESLHNSELLWSCSHFCQAGIGGICNTTYSIQENKRASLVYVTKSKDLNSCEKKVQIVTGSAYTHPCKTCQQVNQSGIMCMYFICLCRTLFDIHTISSFEILKMREDSDLLYPVVNIFFLYEHDPTEKQRSVLHAVVYCKHAWASSIYLARKPLIISMS